MTDPRFYIHCPQCGKLLCKSEEGTKTEIKCSKCQGTILYSVKDGTITTSVEERSTKEKKTA